MKLFESLKLLSSCFCEKVTFAESGLEGKMSSSDAVNEPSSRTEVVLRNLKGAMYKMSVQELPSSVTCMAVCDSQIFVSLDTQGLFAYK